MTQRHTIDTLRGEIGAALDGTEDGTATSSPCFENLVEGVLRAVLPFTRLADDPIAAAPAPNPSPAAKGGEAEVRIARIEAQMLQHGGVDSDDMEWMARMVRSHLATPTAEQAWDVLQTAALAAPSPQPAHSDDLAVDRFAVAMKAKLADARAKGKGGWYDETACSQQYLSDELRRHALKPDPLDVANFAMFLHQRNEEIALPSPQPANAVREALNPGDIEPHNDVERTVRIVRSAYGWTVDKDGRVCGLVAGDQGYESTHIVIYLDELRDALWLKPDAALASDPAPSSPDLEVLRAENEAYRNAARDMLNNWRFGNFYAPQQPEPLYVRKFAQLHKAGSDRIASQVISRSQAASDPAPAGEAVEPVAWRWRMAADRVWNYQEDRQRIPDAIHEALYAHPAPEDTARLREDLERVTEYARAATVAITSLTAGGSEYFGKRIGDLYTADLPFCLDRIRSSRTAMNDALNAAIKGRQAAERERDDTRKALETVREEGVQAGIDLARRAYEAHDKTDRGWVSGSFYDALNREGVARVAATRSASREGASDE